MELSNLQENQVWQFEHVHPLFNSEAQKERIMQETVTSIHEIFKNRSTADAED